MEIKNRVRQYIVDNFLYGDDNGLKNEDSLLDKGVIDSTGIVELLSYVEDVYDLEVADEEISRDNFDSIDKLSSFIETKIST